jgi:hypothetical protein
VSAAANDERTHIITMVSGVMVLKDFLHEYMFRGESLDRMNLLDFMLDTYDAKADGDDGPGEPEITNVNTRFSGRLRNPRVRYRQGFTRVGRCRVFRTVGHETLPHFVGRWLPRNDRPNERELYCASILALLKPWTDLSDLKTDIKTFEQAFQAFFNNTDKRNKDVIENIQYYYECYDGAVRH